MIIDTAGNILQAMFRENGVIVQHYNEEYETSFAICLFYDEEQWEAHHAISELKEALNSTDYMAIKHADGVLSDEEYEEVREQRQSWRDEINRIQEDFHEPTITDEEILEAERLAMENARKAEEAERLEDEEELETNQQEGAEGWYKQ